jgi:lambda family phage portal protein
MITQLNGNDSDVKAFLKQLEQRAKASTEPERGVRRPTLGASSWGGAGWGAFPASMPAGRGGFKGGGFDRLNETWNPGPIGPNQANRWGGGIMRQRARDLVINHPLIRSAVDAYIANVVQQGITPKPKFSDKVARQQWIAAWERWGGTSPHATRECDITEDCTIYELQALWLEEVIVGGGCLMHFVEMPRKGRSIPLAIELLPEERFADDITMSGTNHKTANPVISGHEVDFTTGKTVAYWVRQTNNMSDALPFPQDFQPIRIPREQCEYAYFKHRLGQKRGYTLMHAAVLWAHALGYYVDNELDASAAKSSISMVITTTDDDSDFSYNAMGDWQNDGQVTDAYGNPMTSMQPGTIMRARPGDKVDNVGPNVPGSDSNAWIELIERSVSIGMGVSYEEACRDFSKGSFSSVRASANSDRIRFRRMAQFTEAHFCNPIWPRFSADGARMGIDGFPSLEEFASERDDWIATGWEGPHWDSVNPSDDALADDIRIKNGTKTRAECIPGDIDEHFDALASERDTIEAHNLNFETGMTPPANAGSTDQQLSQRDQQPQPGKAKK